MYKNQLQELAQRSCFNLPSYACIREGPDHAPRFKATVNFNGETFESPAFCTTLRQAEHSAAEVALAELSNRGPSRSLAARVLDETGVYKNLLQETAHRAGLNLPVYTTVRSGPGHVPVFHCTVELAGLSFTGEPAKTKKQAQKNAAMAAWSVLKQLPQMQSSSLSTSTKLESERKDEQEQIVVARALAKLCPSSTLQRGRPRSAPPIGQDNNPSSSGIHLLYPMQYPRTPSPNPSWSYPNYSPEMRPMFRMWQPERPFQILPPPAPQILPVVHHSQYILPQDMNRAMPINVRSRSQVTIQEIQEESLPRDANSNKKTIIAESVVQDKPQEDRSGGLESSSSSSSLPKFTQLPPPPTRCQPSNMAPVRIRSVGPISSSPRPRPESMISSPRPRPESMKAWVPSSSTTPLYTVRPPPRIMQTGGRMPYMAPAVQIRSVIPVCSAPPTRVPEPSPSKEGDDVGKANSELGNLHI
ncbi:hypothetical protein ACHQM5_026754 [Ranunculus cassubicifolius]